MALTHNIVVVNVPSIPDKHPEQTDANLYRHAADELDGEHGLHDPLIRAAVVDLLREVAAELDAVP